MVLQLSSLMGYWLTTPSHPGRCNSGEQLSTLCSLKHNEWSYGCYTPITMCIHVYTIHGWKWLPSDGFSAVKPSLCAMTTCIIWSVVGLDSLHAFFFIEKTMPVTFGSGWTDLNFLAVGFQPQVVLKLFLFPDISKQWISFLEGKNGAR